MELGLAGNLVKLKVSDIRVGEPLAWPVYDSNGTFLVKKGFIIKSLAQVERLIDRGAFGDQSDLSSSLSAESNESEVKKPKDISPFKILEDVTSQLAIVLASSTEEETDFSKEMMKMVENIQRACDRDPHAALASLFVLEGSSYPIKHSVDVAVLSEVLAKSSSFKRAERKSIVAAALTMNISMIELQEKLYRQEAPLTDKQKEAIQHHPKQSVIILKKAGVDDQLWLKCVLTHHEAITGTGYPNKLKGAQYPQATQLIALADQYCARLSPRAYRDPLLHKGILRDILLDKGQTVEPEIAALFIKELGFFPPGLIVQLANTEIGVVTKRGDRPDAPIVHVCVKPQTGTYAQPVMRNTKLESYKIRKIISSDNDYVTFNRRTLWQFNEE